MKYLFSNWDKIAQRIQKSPRVFLFFDYDGTLTPIVSSPEQAEFSYTVKNLIRKLEKHPKFIISIISGRSLKNIKEMVGLRKDSIIYAGNHGLEIEGRGIKSLKMINKKSARPVIKNIYSSLRRAFSRIDGVKIEDKGATLSVHYRLARPRNKSLIKKEFNKILAPYVRSKKVKIYSGKEVLEVRPNLDWDKGTAVKWLLKGNKPALAIYLGDDVTDRDAFRAIKGRGISVFVGSAKRGIGADYFLKSPKDVERFINKLLKL